MIDKKLVEKLTKVDWDMQSFNAYPLFISSVATLSGFRLCWGLSYTHFLCFSRNKNVEWRYDIEDYKRNGAVFWDKIKTLRDLQELIAEYRETYNKAVVSAVYDEQKLQDMSVEELIALLELQVQRLYESVGISHILESVNYVCEHTMLQKYHVDPSLVKPSEPSFLRKAGMYAHTLCTSFGDDTKILEEFNKKYAWIQNSYLGRNDITIEDVKKLAHEVQPEPEQKVSYPDESKEFVLILSHLFSWQDERKGNGLESTHMAEPVLDALAEKLNLSSESVRFLLPDEIKKITNPEFQKELDSRTRFFVDYSTQDLKRVLYTGAEAQEFIEEFSDTKEHEGSEIKGSVASPGIARGIVRVCLSMESIAGFKEGEILVASMTRPEYISAMKKAVAFVTDEGGITSHAAIVAREMKKPCIIGTKIATKVLKDGDEVEVDAERGVVTIIKRG